MARTRDAVVLAIRAIREGFRVLRSLGLPVTPSRLRMFEWIPEPILVPLFQRRIANELMETAMVKHANVARDEVRHLVDEFLALARTTSVPTPTIDRLYPHLDPDTPLIPEGSAEIPLDWRGVWAGVGAWVGLLAGAVVIAKRLRKW
jgi:2-dehydropantoate 2-reductase